MNGIKFLLSIVILFGIVNALARVVAKNWFKYWYSKFLIRLTIIIFSLPLIIYFALMMYR